MLSVISESDHFAIIQYDTQLAMHVTSILTHRVISAVPLKHAHTVVKKIEIDVRNSQSRLTWTCRYEYINFRKKCGKTFIQNKKNRLIVGTAFRAPEKKISLNFFY